MLVHIEWSIEWAIVGNNLLTVSGNVNTKCAPSIEVEEQPQRLPVRLTIEDVAVRGDRAKPHRSMLPRAANVCNGVVCRQAAFGMAS